MSHTLPGSQTQRSWRRVPAWEAAHSDLTRGTLHGLPCTACRPVYSKIVVQRLNMTNVTVFVGRPELFFVGWVPALPVGK